MLTGVEGMKADLDEEPKEEPTSQLKIESWEDVFRAMCIVRGIDPNQVQAMAKFSDFDNNDERSYYPTQQTAIAISQLRMYGRANYKDDDWNEYELIADILSVGYMGYKGFKSEQYKDITSGQPNLDKLQGLPEETQKGILSGLFNRGKTE
jgi:hypothetical protein